MTRKNKIPLIILTLFFFSFLLHAQELYVGVNYHPHDDKNPVKIKHDIQLMKDAGFKVVRMGHLAWDSYEPSEGKFDFEWFDNVMYMTSEAGIKVILDIAIRPAPIKTGISYTRTTVIWKISAIRFIKSMPCVMRTHFQKDMPITRLCLLSE